MSEQWTAHGVIAAFVSAHRVLSVTVGRVGHKNLQSGFLNYLYDASDINAQYHHELERQRKGESTFHKRNQSKTPPKPIDISRSDMVLCGLNGMPKWLDGPIVEHPLLRSRLSGAILARIHRQSDRTLCRITGWPLASYQRHRDKGAQIIADWLNEHQIKPWGPQQPKRKKAPTPRSDRQWQDSEAARELREWAEHLGLDEPSETVA